MNNLESNGNIFRDGKDGFRLIRLEDFSPFVDEEVLNRIHKKTEPLRSSRIGHVSATYYGGGVAELLSSLTLLMNGVGIKADWPVLNGSPDFFSITKKMHNALQGSDINLSNQKKEIYESVIFENASRNQLDYDFVVVHDPQPLPMILHYRKRNPWIWHCHVDLTDCNMNLWHYLKNFIERYDAAIFTMDDYFQDLTIPQLAIPPAIDPFSITNKELSEAEIKDRLDHYDIPTDLPIIAQVSRFDRWKDPKGVIEAFKIARKEVDATLVLLGNIAQDDPEGQKVFESLYGLREERILILSAQDTALVNALQRTADVILQKSIREGFGLTVTEAMWKSTPVIGGNTGGICLQIDDGENGFLVSSVEEAAQRIVQLLKDKKLRESMGEKARRKVIDNFLMTTLLERYIDVLNGFDFCFENRVSQPEQRQRLSV